MRKIHGISRRIFTRTLLATTIFVLFCFHFRETRGDLQDVYKKTTNQGEVVCRFIDVGYGLSILIIDEAHNCILIDGGYARYGKKIKSILSKEKIKKINLLINTHPHPDHIEGLIPVIRQFPVSLAGGSYPLDHELVPPEFTKAVKEKKIEYRTLRRGDSISFSSSLVLNILHPEHLEEDMNDSSLVIQVKINQISMILASDIGKKPQRNLSELFGKNLHSYLVQIPHHGGKGDESFAEETNPQIAVISVGKNPYGNPHKETLDWYVNRGAALLRTDAVGDITLQFELGEPMSVCLKTSDAEPGREIAETL